MLTDDCVRLVLHHTCHLRVERYSRKLQGSLATGEWNKVFDIKQRPLISGNGMINIKETTLLSYTIQPHGGCVAVRTSDLDTANAAAKDFELCLQDTIGDEGGLYDEVRLEDDEVFDRNAGLVRFPCLGWGQRRRVTYTIALSRSISTSIAFDALIVPTSWWIDDCEGTYWVVQMTHAGEIHEELFTSRKMGCVVVGWKTDATSDH